MLPKRKTAKEAAELLRQVESVSTLTPDQVYEYEMSYEHLEKQHRAKRLKEEIEEQEQADAIERAVKAKEAYATKNLQNMGFRPANEKDIRMDAGRSHQRGYTDEVGASSGRARDTRCWFCHRSLDFPEEKGGICPFCKTRNLPDPFPEHRDVLNILWIPLGIVIVVGIIYLAVGGQDVV